ncbi:hypothetical protein [Acinetobacter populi]|jgi:hypothetical protein|nr:hypothetical protein [Acinetobacter populi]MCH4248474.1 hypothetical protein [Acinetobacter populi]
MKTSMALMFSLLCVGCSHLPVHSKQSNHAQQSIEVYKSLQSRQCENSGLSLSQLKQELQTAKIQVLAEREGDTGKAYIQMCGAPDGRLGVFSIDVKDLSKATTLGFKPFTY